MKLRIKPRKNSQDGIAMMVALMSLVLLAAIGVGLMFMADTENSINNNYRDAQKAYFAARAGADNVRVLLSPGGKLNPNPIVSPFGLAMPSSGSNTGVIYVLNAGPGETVNPISGTFVDDELCQEQFTGLGLTTPTGAGVPCGTGTGQIMANGAFYQSDKAYLQANSLPVLTNTDIPGLGGADALAFKWVRITNKQNLMGLTTGSPSGGPQTVDGTSNNGRQVCWTGKQEVTIPTGTTCAGQIPPITPVWLITSLAVTPKIGANPGSRRIVQMEAALNPAIIPPGTIAAKAPVNLQGSFVLNAYDSCKSTCTYDKSGNATGCTGPYGYAVFTENTVTQTGNSGQTLSGAGTDPTVEPVSKLSVPDKNWPYNMDDLINQLKQTAQTANYSCTGTQDFLAKPPTYLNCGTQSSAQFFINNDPTKPVTFPPSMLSTPPVEPNLATLPTINEYIPGSVKLTSAAQGSGILIVDGDLEINGGLNWYGLLLVRGKVSFTGGAGQSTNLFGAVLAGQDIDSSKPVDTFGGSINFHYDTCALANNGGTRPPILLATHELMY
jgi:hypothetical protein